MRQPLSRSVLARPQGDGMFVVIAGRFGILVQDPAALFLARLGIAFLQGGQVYGVV